MKGRQTPELVARIRELRRRTGPVSAPATPEDKSLHTQVDDLRTQVAHLEQLVQGLQDSVYRDFRRHQESLTDLQARIEPAAVAAALSEHARNRGL